jgi:hypothetical protein
MTSRFMGPLTSPCKESTRSGAPSPTRRSTWPTWSTAATTAGRPAPSCSVDRWEAARRVPVAACAPTLVAGVESTRTGRGCLVGPFRAFDVPARPPPKARLPSAPRAWGHERGQPLRRRPVRRDRASVGDVAERYVEAALSPPAAGSGTLSRSLLGPSYPLAVGPPAWAPSPRQPAAPLPSMRLPPKVPTIAKIRQTLRPARLPVKIRARITLTPHAWGRDVDARLAPLSIPR